MNIRLSEPTFQEGTVVLAEVEQDLAYRERHKDSSRPRSRAESSSETSLTVPAMGNQNIERLSYVHWVAKVEKSNPGVVLSKAAVDDALRASFKKLLVHPSNQKYLVPLVAKVQRRLLEQSDQYWSNAAHDELPETDQN